jgi:RNA recognition motif-containing protein
MSNKIFIGGLSWGTNEDGLKDSFSKFGEITDARVITDRATGRSRGFGFVTFEETTSVMDAVSSMNDVELDGRVIKVTEAIDKPRNNNQSNSW